MTPIIRRAGDRITLIRFRVTHEKPMHQYAEIMSQIPDSAAKRAWLAGKQEMVVRDGWVEVRP